MSTIVAIVIVVIAAAIVVGILAKPKKERSANHRYFKRVPLSENEQMMYWKLVKALPEHIVLAQVGMSRCIDTKTIAAFRTISQKTLDFVICDKASQIIATIEIDDATHRKQKRIKADTTKDAALKSAGIRSIRWETKNLPSEDEIRRACNVSASVATVSG